jgi:cytochrome b561
MNNKILFISLLIGTILCLPISGFIYGFISCSDCENSFFGFLGRIFIGLVHVPITVITLGRPWDNEAGTSATDIRIYVFIAFIIITGIAYLYLNRRRIIKKRKTAANNI